MRAPQRPAGDDLDLLGAAAAAGAVGEPALLAEIVARARSCSVRPERLRETLRMLVPYAGYPRALAALKAAGLAPPEPAPEPDPDQRAALGRAAFAGVYGETSERVLAGLKALDPLLPAWTLEHAYGRVLARPGLSLAERELVAVSLLTALGGLAEPLLGHMRGARRLGASVEQVARAVEAVPDILGPERKAQARALLPQSEPH